MAAQTLSEKIIARCAGLDEVRPGQFVEAKVDFCLGNDITAPIAIREFRSLGDVHVFDPTRIALIPDHFTPNKDIKSAEQCKLMREFAREEGLEHYYEVGRCGIEHAFLPEKGLVLPGELIIGADSHTCTYGAVGAFATGVGSTDLAAVMATGKVWLRVPETMRFVFRGELPEHVGGKDLILRVEHTLTFTDSIKRDIPIAVTDGVEFEQVIVGDGDRERQTSDTGTFAQVILLQKELNLGVTHAVEFGTGGLVIRDWDALSDHFNPGWSATLESDNTQVVFLYPYDLPTQSLTMKRPEFGDTRSDFRRRGSVHRNRSGQARIFSVPMYSKFTIHFNGLLRKRAEEFRVRIIQFLDDFVRYEDANGVAHKVSVLNTELNRDQTGLDYVNVSVTLEKAERVDLDPVGAQ